MMKTILITGGCGFIGTNAALHFLERGNSVIITDNLSRKGSEINYKLLSEAKGEIEFVIGLHIEQDADFFKFLINDRKVDVVLHTAAQVAVTTSVSNPVKDFEINARGTLNILEAARNANKKPIFIFTSTNKVYGEMKDAELLAQETRYEYRDKLFGIPETQPLDFHSPYGCSKGCADQYTRDYYRIYGLPTIVLRQSCIFGSNQFGIADQGWVCYLAMLAFFDKPITIYGDGKQVRDVLFIDDLNRAFELAASNIGITAGQIYNIGGGPRNRISVLELISILEKIFDKKIELKFDKARPGDQLVYISDIRKAKKDFCWEPEVDLWNGLKKMVKWIKENKEVLINFV